MSNEGIGGECDFCSAPEIVMSYPCRDFLLDPGKDGLPGHGSSGAWGACRVCHELIQRGDRTRLAARSAKRLVRRYRLPYKPALAAVRENHDAFWSHREGEPVPSERFGPDPTEGLVAPEHRLGPDYAAAEAAVRERVRGVLAIRDSSIGAHAIYYVGFDDDLVRKAELSEQDGQLTQIGPSENLGATWDAVRVAVMVGAA